MSVSSCWVGAEEVEQCTVSCDILFRGGFFFSSLQFVNLLPGSNEGCTSERLQCYLRSCLTAWNESHPFLITLISKRCSSLIVWRYTCSLVSARQDRVWRNILGANEGWCISVQSLVAVWQINYCTTFITIFLERRFHFVRKEKQARNLCVQILQNKFMLFAKCMLLVSYHGQTCFYFF